MKIAHIVNPVKVTDKSDLYIAQPITFETMRRAKKYVNEDDVDVELFYTCYQEDLPVRPKGFSQTKLLEESILDYGKFDKKRKLPLIKDILDRLYESSDADYFIYTNVDIAVMPYFYSEIKDIINQGYDAFVINRRTIDEKYTSINEISQMYSEIGQKHPGYDCFVFKKDVYSRYKLGSACIGANWIGRVLITNLIINSKVFRVFKDEHLTFHIGDDRSWKISDFNVYDNHNEQNLLKILDQKNEDIIKIDNEILKDIIEYHSKIEKKKNIKLDLSSFMNQKNIFYNIFSKTKTPINEEPIFIVGFPRSGTTFLLDSLVSQKNIYSLPETHFFDIVSKNINLNNKKEVFRKVQKWVPLSDDAKEFISYCINEIQLDKKLLFEIIIIDYLSKQVPTEELYNVKWIEKTPDHSLYLNEISTLYPNAKFIYILRNPISTFNSWRRVASQWGGTSKTALEYSKMWKYRLESVLAFKSKYPNKLIFIKLENLRNLINHEMSKIMNYIKSDYDKSLLGKKNIKSEFLFLEDEIWKKESVSKNIKKNDTNAETDLTELEKLQVIFSLKKYLSQFNYLNLIDKPIVLNQNEIKEYILNSNEEDLKYNNSGNSFLSIEKKLKKLTEIKFLKNPIKKYRYYKELILEYRKIKG